MASEERKAADNKIKEQNFQSSLGAGEQQAETDAFQCSRCKQVGGLRLVASLYLLIVHALQRKCRYRQAQTRSADEPMTVCLSLLSRFSPWVLIRTFLNCRLS